MMIYIVIMLGFQPKSPTMKVLHGAARLLVRAASCDVATSERCFQLQGWADTAGPLCLIINKGGTIFRLLSVLLLSLSLHFLGLPVSSFSSLGLEFDRLFRKNLD